MASISDVAKLANVSKSTVSLVINETGYVSEKTKKKVHEAMETLSYIPNQLGKNLSNKKSNIIGVVIPDITHPFFSEFVKYLEEELYKKGFMLMVCSTLCREEVELEYLKWLNNYTIDGIIMGVHTLDINHYLKTDRPIVSLDRYLSSDIPTVSSDHELAAKITVDKLCENGCQKVVRFVGSSNANVSSELYMRECKELFEQQGGEMKTHVMKKNTFALEEYLAEANLAFDTYQEIDAFIGTDMIISQCLKIADKKNIQVPKTLKLISYDGTYITDVTTKEISCVKQNINLLATRSTELITDIILKNKNNTESKWIPVEWKLGETTIF